MVAEDHPAVGRRVVASIVEPHRRRRTRGIEREDPGGDEPAVKPIAHRVRAQRGEGEPGRVPRFTSGRCRPAEPGRAQSGNQSPDDNTAQSSHEYFSGGVEIEYALTFAATGHRVDGAWIHLHDCFLHTSL